MVSGTMATVKSSTSPPATAAHVANDGLRNRVTPRRELIARAP
jgi:hypothetical protein